MAQYEKSDIIVKKPKDDKPLTEEQAIEWVRCAEDYEYYIRNYCYVQSTMYGGVQLFEPRSYQKRFLDTIYGSRFVSALLPRQSGKTATAAAMISWYVIFHSNYGVGVASKNNANVKDIMDRFKFIYENLPFFLKAPVTEYNVFNIVFDNNSFVKGQTINHNTFRGASLDFIYIDEMAFQSPDKVRGMWKSLYPIITAAGSDSNQKMVITSTPNGTGDLFSQIVFNARAGKNNFKLVEMEEGDMPERETEEFKRGCLREMSYNEYLSEYLCHFISNKGTLVNSTVIESMEVFDPVEVKDDVSYYVDSVKGKTLIVSVDVSEGIGQDSHAVQVIDIDNFEQVAEFKNNILNQTEFTKKFISLLDQLFRNGAKDIYYGIENNGISRGVISLVLNSKHKALERAIPISNDHKSFGISTNVKTKMNGCMKLKDLLETHALKIYSKDLVNELRFFIKKGGSFAAEQGMTDDLVMALVVGMNVLDQLKYEEENVYDRIATLDMVDDKEQEDEPMPIIF